ncbi:Cysteine-rich protein 2-binding protein [Geranomyces variabilis]|uniref:Cysteine-rich protein 2-binding protein n=1 Tax=Geranomyces variabilis TaxID=109894 RepID=A0AAD5TFM2_9FUNG|nr:Cysteine-rich protein 2-binding protein [Geranomyces variabilis]
MLRCSGPCQQLFHSACLKCLNGTLLHGDSFFAFTCSVCGGGKQTCERNSLSWIIITQLVIYNLLLRDPEKEYVRWREDICRFIELHWDYLKPGKPKSATWYNTVASVLSTAAGKTFRSGTEKYGQPGWWSLIAMEPPQSNAKAKSSAASRKQTAPSVGSSTPANEIQAVVKRPRRAKDKKLKSYSSLPPAESDSDDSGWSPPRKRRSSISSTESRPSKKSKSEPSLQLTRKKFAGKSIPTKGYGSKSLPASAFVTPLGSPLQTAKSTPAFVSESESDIFGATDSELSELSSLSDTEDEQESNSRGTLYFSPQESVTAGPVYREPAITSWDSLDDFFSSEEDDYAPTPVAPRVTKITPRVLARKLENVVQNRPDDEVDSSAEEDLDEEEEFDDESETSEDESIKGTDQAQAPPARGPVRKPKPSAPAHHAFLTTEQEFALLQRLSSFASSALAAPLPAAVARLKCKIHLRRLKRSIGLPIFDLDARVSRCLKPKAAPLSLLPTKTSSLPSVVTLPNGRSARLVIRGMDDRTALARFRAVRGISSTSFRNSFLSRIQGYLKYETIVSPYTGKPLLPQIWESCEIATRTPALQTLHAVTGMHIKADGTTSYPISFQYLTAALLPDVDALLSATFWPGISVKEALQYPDFTIVATHARRLVVAVAIMTPDGYLSYIAVRPGWEGAGLARFMLFHLIQTIPGRDITLHVSANNKAMLLYQRLGFKPEEFIVGFYNKYLPAESHACKNAFFVRLRR